MTFKSDDVFQELYRTMKVGRRKLKHPLPDCQHCLGKGWLQATAESACGAIQYGEVKLPCYCTDPNEPRVRLCKKRERT
jgi:hypothetical protein